jgi:hypothetical protein
MPADLAPPAARPPLLISVIITCHNYERFVGEAIESVLAQTYPHVECICVDDGSTDNSREVIKSYPSVHAIFTAQQRQARASRVGFDVSRGDVIVFLDADDMLAPDACARIAEDWEEGLSALFYRLRILRDDKLTDEYLPRYPFIETNPREYFFKTGSLVYAPTSGDAFGRDLVADVMTHARGFTFNGPDTWFCFSAVGAGQVKFSQHILGTYRIHGANLSMIHTKPSFDEIMKVLYYAYWAQQCAKDVATARGIAHGRRHEERLQGVYNLRYYAVVRDEGPEDLRIPRMSALAVISESLSNLYHFQGMSPARKLANFGLTVLFLATPFRFRRWFARAFYGWTEGSSGFAKQDASERHMKPAKLAGAPFDGRPSR